MRTLWLSLSLAALVFPVFPTTSLAQSVASASPKASPSGNYADEPFVIERLDITYDLKADGTGSVQRTGVVKIQSEAGLRQFGVISSAFAGASEHVEFQYARVREPDGTVTETPVSGAMEQPAEVTRAAPFYSDLKEEQLPIKNLRVGDTLEWELRVVRTVPEAPGEFWGGESFLPDGAVVREESIELRVPAGKAVTVWTNPALGTKPKETKEAGELIYRWEDTALKPTVGPEAEAGKAAKKTKLLTAEENLDAEQGKLPSVAWTTFPNWAAVGAWYRGLEGERAVPDAEIKAKVAELTAGKTSEEDKVRAVYAYVSTQIRYIGVAFGIGRYQPHQAIDVLNNQYGDCKDKATLLTAMLAAAGVPSDAALIGAGVRFNEAVPSPAAFNHLITHLTLGGQDVWLDSTEEIAPYRMMYAVLRDRQALVIPAMGAATIERTPANPPFAAFQTWTAKGTLDKDGVSDSHIAIAERGDDALVLRVTLRQLGPAQYDEFAQRLLNAVGYAGTSSHAEFSRPEDTDTPFTINLDYHREKAGDWDNLKIIPQLAPTVLPVIDEKQPPVATINLGAPRTETSTAEMKLPEGWTVELPEAVHEKAAFATYDQSYRFDKGTLYSERRLVILQQKIPATDWKTYKKWTDATGLENETYVQLRRAGEAAFITSLNAGAPPPSPADVSNPEAQALIQQAIEALRKKDDATASSLLERAKTLNPTQRMLWSGFGYLALQRGRSNEALADMQNELATHPDSPAVYAVVVQMLRAMHYGHRAEDVLQTWENEDPKSPEPLKELAEMLVEDKQPAAAVDAANKALQLMPEADRKKDEMLQLTLGTAQMRAGMQDQGVVALVALLKTTDKPEIMNNAAFELANAKKELALDDEKQRVAIDELTKISQSQTLEDPAAMLRTKSALLIASWDTMGWILFQEGKPREAKPYIEAAWTNGPDDELKMHLDQVNAALGISERPHHAPLPKADVTVTATAMQGQAMRTIPLGPANGRQGVAEYRLLLSHGKVERAEPAGEKTIEGADEMMKRADFTHFFPADSDAKLVREVMLNCFMGKCQIVVMP